MDKFYRKSHKKIKLYKKSIATASMASIFYQIALKVGIFLSFSYHLISNINTSYVNTHLKIPQNIKIYLFAFNLLLIGFQFYF